MLDFAFKNKHMIVVISLLLVLIGTITLIKTPVDILPTYKTPTVQVLTLYPGMPAEVMEKDITMRLERWMSQANGIVKQESKTMNGVSIVRTSFSEWTDPSEALAQISALAMSDLYFLPPGTLPSMIMPYDPTASTPLAFLAVSSEKLNEKELYDIAYFDLRAQLGSVKGIIVPAVYGGQLRRIFLYVDPDKLSAYNLTQTDVLNALHKNNTMIPTGDINIGGMNYSVNANGLLPKIEDFNTIVIKMNANGAPIFLKDVGYAKDSGAIQTNIVHIDGKRQVYVPIFKRPGANTIEAIEAVKAKLPEIKPKIDPSITMEVLMDQSSYVRHSIDGLVKEALIGLVLVSVALLLFLGSLRATFIVALSIPLSIMVALIGVYFTGNSINAMTLGGIALAIGLLVDDSIVVLENFDKHLRLGKKASQAAYDAAKEVALPVLVTTLTIIIVFFPIVFLTGIAKFLFTPLAIAVSLAMIGSRFFSMTLVPIMAAMLYSKQQGYEKPKGFLGAFDRGFHRLTQRYVSTVERVIQKRKTVLGISVLLFVLSLFGLQHIGKELFPQMDIGQISIDVRMETGTRIEKTEEKITQVEHFLKQELGSDAKVIISNIGVLNDWPAAYTTNSGTQDATIAIQLDDNRAVKTAGYVSALRVKLKEHFPGVSFIFNTSGMVNSALNKGLPSPIDIKITGKDLYVAQEIAIKVRDIVQNTKGTQDVRINQRYDHPEIQVEIDRTKSAMLGTDAQNIVQNTVSAMTSSVSFKPSFWIDPKNGNHYFVGVTYPEVKLDDPQAVENIAISTGTSNAILLKNVAKTSITSVPNDISHLNIERVTDVYANVEGRDIASVAADIDKKLEALRATIPAGYRVEFKGEIQNMEESFNDLGIGLALAAILVYLIIVPLLRSFTLPLIIISVIPLGFTGVIVMLLLTDTYLNIQSVMGIIMMIGISVAYSNLLVDKMNTLLNEGKPLQEAILHGVGNRFRPIMMTAIVAILALMPMAIGYETGGEANIPLARAIIGGVGAATLLSLFVVPILFYLFNQKSAKQGNINETI